jgi:hypothetical protein
MRPLRSTDMLTFWWNCIGGSAPNWRLDGDFE